MAATFLAQLREATRSLFEHNKVEATGFQLNVATLEDRILYSAVPMLDVALNAVDSAGSETYDGIELDNQTLGFAEEYHGEDPAFGEVLEVFTDDDYLAGGSSSRSLQLVFIDEGVEDYDQLLNGLRSDAGSDVELLAYLLRSDSDGIDQISSILGDFDEVAAIHIISHGSDGQLRLGDGSLTASNLGGYASQLTGWRDHLSESADILLYGCNLAETSAGQELIDAIAALTDSDVAASDDVTGSSKFGGDWDLEYATGVIDVGLAFSSELQQTWEHKLEVLQDAVTTDVTDKNVLTDSVDHTTGSGDNRLMLVGVSFGEDKGQSVATMTYNGVSLTRVGEQDAADNNKARVEIWALVAPDIGTHTLDVAYTGSSHEGATIGIMTFTGVDQSNPLGAFSAATDDSDTLTTSVDSAAGELIFGVAAFNKLADVDLVPDAGLSEKWDLYIEKANGSGITMEGSAGATLTWTTSDTKPWVAAAVSIKAAPIVANNDLVSTPSGTATVIDVLANDTEPNGETLAIIDWSDPANGSVTNVGNGNLDYTPGSASFLGSDSFEYVATNGDDGLIHYWNLDGQANDLVGDADGVLNGGVSTIGGAYGNALSFDEVNDYVEISDVAYSDEFTVSFKFKIDDYTGSEYMYLYSHGNVDFTNSLNVFFGEQSRPGFAGTIKTVFGDADDSYDLNGLNFDASSVVGDGLWHTYTLTVDATNGARVYLDGTLRASNASQGGDAFNPTGNLFLGARQDLSSVRMFGGGLDSVAIFDRSLESSEVALLGSNNALTTFSTDTATVNVTVTNQAPTANPGLVYVIDENSDFTLNGSSSSDPEGAALTYAWDLNYDGVTFDQDVTGVNPTVSWATLQSQGIGSTGDYQIALRVSDGSLNSSIVVADLTVVAPFEYTAVNDSVSVSENGSLSVTVGSGVFANDLFPQFTSNGLTLNYSATADTTGGSTWDNAQDEGDWDWDFGAGVTRTTSPTTANNNIGAAWLFSGANGGTTNSDFNGLEGNPSDSSASFEIWINPSDAVGQEVIFETGSNGQGTAIWLDGSNLTFSSSKGASNGAVTTDISADISANEFIQIVGVVDIVGANTDLRLYVNGVLVGSDTGINLLDSWSNGGGAGLGRVNGATMSPVSGNFQGEMTEFRFYESALTGTEVHSNYEAMTFDRSAIVVQNVDTSATLGSLSMNANGSFTYNTNGQFDYLAAGESATDSFTYVAGNGTQSDAGVVTITISGANDAPTAIALSGSTISEESIAATVGTLSTTDPDTNDTHTYSVDDSRFEVVSGVLRLKAGEKIDYEAETSVILNVTSTDGSGASVSSQFTVNVTDINDNAPVVGTHSFSVSESATSGHSVGTVTAIDADTGTTFTFAIVSGNDSGIFAIDNHTGELTINNPGQLDYESTASYSLGIVASDGANTSTVRTVNVSVIDENDNAPVIASGQVFSVLEHASNTTLVGTVNASDADTGTTFEGWTIVSGNDDGVFTINSATGAITVVDNTNLDYETTQSYSLVLAVSDGTFTSANQSVTVNVVDENDGAAGAILDVNIGLNRVDENAANGSAVGITAFAPNPDFLTQSMTYSLDDDADGRFQINSSTGVVTVKDGSLLNREEAASHTIDVRATKGDSSYSQRTFTIDIRDVDEFDVEAIVDVNTSSNSISESATSGTQVGITAFTQDEDATTNEITYSLDTTFSGLFRIDASTGVVTIDNASSLDYETTTQYTLTVRATSADLSSTTADFVINVLDVNESPVSSISDGDSATNEVSESANIGDLVGITAQASDSDGTASVTYSLSNSAGGLFAINSTTGVVTVAAGLNAEAFTSRNITVMAHSSDGSTSSQAFTIDILDVNEFGVSAISDTDAGVNQISEAASNGDSVGIRASASDGDATGNPVTYSIDEAVAPFAINSSTGVVTVADASQLDFESATTHTITVRATSADGDTRTQTFTIAVTDFNEFGVSPVADSDGASNTVEERASSGTVVGIVAAASDADGTDSVTYSLIDNAGGRFTINAVTGLVTVADGSLLDFETASTHDVIVQALSSDGTSSQGSFTIVVTDFTESLASNDSYSTNEDETLMVDAANGVLANDLLGAGASVSVVVGPTHGTVNMNTDGSFSFTPHANYHGLDQFTYRVTDTSGSTSDAVVSLSVASVNDNPDAQNDTVFAAVRSITIASSTLLQNDLDVDGDAKSITSVSSSANAVVVLQANGSVSYVANNTFTGTDFFTYTISDGHGGTDTATVQVHVVAAAFIPPPQLLPEPESVPEPAEVEAEVETATAKEAKAEENAAEDAADRKATAEAKQTQQQQGQAPPPSAGPDSGQGNGGVAPVPVASDSDQADGESSDGSTGGTEKDGNSSETVNVSASAGRLELSESNNNLIRSSDGSVIFQRFDTSLDPLLVWNEFDHANDSLEEGGVMTVATSGAIVGASSAFSVGYVFWTIRSGLLATSLLAQMPAWKLVDPLMVLDYLDGDALGDGPDDSLQSMLENSNNAANGPLSFDSETPDHQPDELEAGEHLTPKNP